MRSSRGGRTSWLALELANTLAFLVTLAGTAIGLRDEVTEWQLIVGAVAIVGLYALLTALRLRPGRYDFKRNSDKYVKFFSNWYERSGRHVICCEDLWWLDEENCAPIKDAIKLHGERTKIYLTETVGTAVQELRESGVIIRSIPAQIGAHVKISIVTDDGMPEMIIRTEAARDDRIRFRRFGGEALTHTLIGFITNWDNRGA